jgi:hypothetical protein
MLDKRRLIPIYFGSNKLINDNGKNKILNKIYIS